MTSRDNSSNSDNSNGFPTADPSLDEKPDSRVVDFLRPWAERVASLDPYQRRRLMRAQLDNPHGPVRLREALSADDLEQSAFLTNARLLLSKLRDSEQRATAKGNLNRSFVLAMAAAMRMPERYLEWQPYIKVTREADVWPLEILRTVLQVAGLIRKYKGAFRITHRGLELSGEGQAGMLFAHLFRTFFGRFNLAYLDNMEDDPLLQATFPHSLWMIGRLADGWMDIRRLREMILMEAAPEQLAHERDLERAGVPPHLADEPLWRFETRIIWPLIDFGLLEGRVNPEVADDKARRRTESQQVRKTPLFDRFVGSELAEGPQLVPAHAGAGTQIARLKVTLKGIRPPIWRRIEVPLSYSFRELSDVIVAAFCWSNSHLHEFEIGRRMEPGERSIGMAEELERVPSLLRASGGGRPQGETSRGTQDRRAPHL